VQVTDRHGDIVDEIALATQAPILMLAWDKDGDYLAILQDGNGVVPLWSLSSRRVVPLETNLRDPTFLAWSKTGPQLAIGTAKGNLLIYNKTKKQKIPVVGKHAKKICTGAWSVDGNKLVLGSEDKTLTISNENGDTLLHTEMKHIPIETHFANSSTLSGGKNEPDSILSANLDGKSLILFDLLDEKEDPTELTFGGSNHSVGCKYGEIRAHSWFENGLVMVGFSLGHLLVISTNPKEMGKEKFCSKFHTSNFVTFAYNPQLKRAASAGDDGIRIIDLREFKEIVNDFIPPEDLEHGRVSDICWSPDGQILTIGTYAGNVYNFLAKMSVLNAKYGTTAAFLSSLREISVVDALKRTPPLDITLKVEPTLIAVGGKHVAAGMNNKVQLRHTILYCTILSYAGLNCDTLYYTILCYSVLYNVILCYSIYTVLR
jgi:WD repeat-containing protein 19